MVFEYHNELMLAVEEARRQYVDSDELMMLAKKRMKAWKKDKKLMKNEMDGMREEIKEDENSLDELYKSATNLIADISFFSNDINKVAELRVNLTKVARAKQLYTIRKALFKQAIVVHSHSHNETIEKADKHFKKFITMRADFAEAVSKMNEVVPEEMAEEDEWGIKPLTETIHSYLNPARYVAKVVRPLRDSLSLV